MYLGIFTFVKNVHVMKSVEKIKKHVKPVVEQGNNGNKKQKSTKNSRAFGILKGKIIINTHCL
jgi:hypothetical protein